MPARKAVEVVRLVRLETYDSSSVSCALPASAMPWFASACCAVLDVVPELRAHRIREPRRERSQHGAASS
jgi:hypothetical protein